ncbi:MAG: hypothetical protein IPM48_02105 [Saprospiraceae bacterium]|nr:hypothetical protein [Saprospiraceae bacterium]
MKAKLWNVLLVVTSLFGYLEWGKVQHSFLFEAEAEFISKLLTDPVSVLHPFTILPMFGQIILIATLFQKKVSRAWTYIGMVCLAILICFMCFVGFLGSNYKIVLSTLPFLITTILTIRFHRSNQILSE